jgi:hypothetical protein
MLGLLIFFIIVAIDLLRNGSDDNIEYTGRGWKKKRKRYY